jgi:D-sedoheptulose 7-phosphate isomerase
MRILDASALTYTQTFLNDSLAVMQAASVDPALASSILSISNAIETSLRAGGKVMFAGNGGSAGDAQHIAGEFVSRLNFDRAPLAGLALTTDTSILTSVGNDYGYDHVFERQILGLGRPGDVFVGISTSGRSPSILKALMAAREKNIVTVCFAGQDPRGMGPLSDYALCAPSDRTPLIQQVHITAAHIICGLVELAMFPNLK